jgi:hypothetical protein
LRIRNGELPSLVHETGILLMWGEMTQVGTMCFWTALLTTPILIMNRESHFLLNATVRMW